MQYRLRILSRMGQYDAFVEADSPEAAKEEFLAENPDYRVEEVTEHEPRLGWTVVGGQGFWGSGPDLATAKAEFRRQGGRLGNGYGVAVFDEETDFVGVSGMGSLQFRGNPPEWTKVEAR